MAASSSISSSEQSLPARVALNLALIAALTWSGDRAIGTALRHYYFTQTSGFHARTTYALDGTTAGVLVFGSSRANHHYAPEPFERQFGARFYNTGRDGQNIFYQTALLSAILRRHTPQTIVLEFDSLQDEPGDLDSLSSLLPYYATHEAVRPYVEMRGPYERFKLLSAIYPFNSQLLSIAVGNLTLNRARYAERSGYVPLSGVWRGGVAPSPSGGKARSPAKIAAFVRFLDLAARSGARVAVVHSPALRGAVSTQDLALAKALCGVRKIPFLDFSGDPAWRDPALYRDADHLNDRGAQRFSALVAAALRRAYGAGQISG